MDNSNTRWRKLPVEIDAVQYVGPPVDANRVLGTPACFSAWPHWLAQAIGASEPEMRWQGATARDPFGADLAVKTLEGTMYASPGDWIIRGVKGELYPCKPDIFAATYEPVAAPFKVRTEPDGTLTEVSA